jgi:hypothetical protein
MMRVDDLAVLAAEIAEPPVVRNHRQIVGLRRDLGARDAATTGPLNQLAERLHVVAQMVVNHPQMQAGRALGLRQPFELLHGRARGVVKKGDVEQHAATDGALSRSRQDVTDWQPPTALAQH